MQWGPWEKVALQRGRPVCWQEPSLGPAGGDSASLGKCQAKRASRQVLLCAK